MKNYLYPACIACFCLFNQLCLAQTYRYIDPPIDVRHYQFELQLNDSTDEIRGKASIQLEMRHTATKIALDLASIKGNGKGMYVREVKLDDRIRPFTHINDKLEVSVDGALETSRMYRLAISYAGIPSDGLIISRNKFGNRTFFADNWPDRARQWIPCNDHPSDKASVEFSVTAPSHYQVVSNGYQAEETNNGNGYTLTRWTEKVPIPTKVMVIGVAGFAVAHAGYAGMVPVSSWVFPEEKEKGFFDYAQALEIIPFFTGKIAPYPFEKLANVQSKTIFGGMENAGCIFYHENSVTGKRKEEGLLAHEIAHQWFGNSATELHWSDLWLSEGFATYLTDCYMEEKYGSDTLDALLAEQRKQVVAFHQKAPERPVVDSLEQNIMTLLNANSYQKGAWFLHMLRRKIGDEFFWKSIAAYYQQYAGKNAVTSDFMATCEKVSGNSLQDFFRQWLNRPGHPVLDIRYSVKRTGELELTIRQLQSQPFRFDLEIVFEGEGQKELRRFFVSERTSIQTLRLPFRCKRLRADPSTDLLATWNITTVK